MIKEHRFDHIYIAVGYTDLRCGVSGLACIVQDSFHMDPFANNLYLFCGRRADRVKLLYWEDSGFVLVYKRLERGRFQWPRSPESVAELSEQQYGWLMEGLDIHLKPTIQPLSGLEFV